MRNRAMAIFRAMSGCFALAALAGCGIGVKHTWLNEPPRLMVSRPPESVEVYASGPPSAPHVDVALLEAGEEEFAASTLDRLVHALRMRAAQLGCDAICIGGATSRTSALSRKWTLDGQLATCVMFTEPRGARDVEAHR